MLLGFFVQVSYEPIISHDVPRYLSSGLLVHRAVLETLHSFFYVPFLLNPIQGHGETEARGTLWTGH